MKLGSGLPGLDGGEAIELMFHKGCGSLDFGVPAFVDFLDLRICEVLSQNVHHTKVVE